MPSECVFVCILCILLHTIRVQGRLSPKLNRVDPMKRFISEPYDIFKFTVEPSNEPTKDPSIQPSSHPTLLPSSSPSLSPISSPSTFPTIAPSGEPSASPSNTSSVPSFMPTIRPSEGEMSSITASPSELYPIEVPDPSNETSSYFNYNPSDANFGPGRPLPQTHIFNETVTSDNSTLTYTQMLNYTSYEGNTWDSVAGDSLESEYWSTFEMGRTTRNKCESSPTKKQSPIDVCSDYVNTECFEHHQIRNRGGDYNLDDSEVTMKILPSKLRIEYSRQNADLNETMLRPPHGDFAHNWNGYIQVTHIDIKIPSEHTICGKRFAGEYQIYFYHPKRRKPIVQSILMEIHPKERTHKHFQKALNEWQAIFDEKRANCWNRERETHKEEDRFVRRMENFLLTSIDSAEVSLRGDTTYDNDQEERNDLSGLDIRAREQSTILDEPEDDSYRFQTLLGKIRRRASNPVFEEHYEKVNLGPASSADGGNRKHSIQSQSQHQNLRRRNIENNRTSILNESEPLSQSPSLATSLIFNESLTPPPSFAPSLIFNESATQPPSFTPTSVPTQPPSFTQTSVPTRLPSFTPTSVLTQPPSFTPTSGPTQLPSFTPTSVPTQPPSFTPISVPTQPPSFTPAPSSTPTSVLTQLPSFTPTSVPTQPPSFTPTSVPTERVRWDPFHPRIINSIYFYGYDGSLTEPPCSEWVSWRVLDTPMQISTAQWTQMRDILFGQIDSDCKRTSVHWRGSVARPTQSLNERPLWQCTRDDYESDVEKRRPADSLQEIVG